MSKDEQNEANLSAYMEGKGTAPEDRDVLPWGYVSLEDALSKLKNFAAWRKGADTEMPNPADIGDALRYAIAHMEGAKYGRDKAYAAKEPDNWISVNYQLPPPEDVDSHDSDFVLCHDGRPFVDRYSYFVEGRMPVKVTGWESGRKPTHWQPLPNPPAK